MRNMTVSFLDVRLVDTNFLQVHTKKPVGGAASFVCGGEKVGIS